MTDSHDVTAARPVTVRQHPAARGPYGRLAPAYGPDAQKAFATPIDAAFAPWIRHARFAPPGPGRAALTMPAMTIAPAAAAAWQRPTAEPDTTPEPAVAADASFAEPPSPPPEVMEASDAPAMPVEPDAAQAVEADMADQPPIHMPFWRAAPPEPAADMVADEPDEPTGAEPPGLGLAAEPELGEEPPTATLDPLPVEEAVPPAAPIDAPPPAAVTADEPIDPPPPVDLPASEAATPTVAPHPVAEEPPGQTAYWATPAEAAKGADSLAWTPPVDLAPGAPRPTPAMAGLWATTPATPGDAFADLPGDPPPARRRNRLAIAGGVAALLAACIAGAVFLPRLLTTGGIPAATFNAPMMVLRAATVGRVASVAVSNGQSVEPSTLLLTIHTEPQPDPAASLLQDRLEAARGRLAALDDALTQPTPNTDAGRSRLADLRSQRAAAANDVAQLRDGVAHLPARLATDQPVRAGIHGVIRSLEAQAGTLTASGVPLVRMLDCDHAFLTVGPNSKQLHAGESVQVRLPNLPPVAATVRDSSGVAEPPNALVIAPAPGAFVAVLSGSCPIGATATVTPSFAGS